MGTPVTDYTGIIDEMSKNGSLPSKWAEGTEKMQQSVAVASSLNPDQEGEAQRLGEATGVGPSIARDNMDAVRRQARMQDLQRRQLELNSPILARQLSDPNFAAIAHDQVDNLSNAEKVFNWIKAVPSDVTNQYKAGHLEFEYGLLGNKAQEGRATPEDWKRVGDIKNELTKLAPQKTFLGGVSGLAGNMLPMLPVALTAGAAGAGAGAGIGAAVGGMGAVPGAVTGLGAGFESGLAERSYSMMAGKSYLDLLDKGVSPETAKYAAGGVGVANAALQLVGVKLLGKPLGKVLGDTATEALSKAFGAQLSDAMTQPTVNRAVTNAVKGWAVRSVQGGATMAAQELVNQVGEDVAKSYDAGQLQTALQTPEGRAEFATRLKDSFVNGVVTMGTIEAGTSMMGFSAEAARARKAGQAAEFFQNLHENATDSKVRERNPGSYEQYIANQAQGSGAENIYVDGQQMQNLLNQSKLAPERMDREMPGFAQQVAEAAQVGSDVMIPTSQYAARLAGTELGEQMLPHMRLDPDAMSAAEAVEFHDKQKELFAEAQKTTQEQMATNEDFAKSAKVVESNIYDQLKATKTMPDDMARTNAQFVRDFVVTQAARSNMTPETFFDKYKYTIQRGAGGGLAQSSIESPEFNDPNILHQAQRAGFDPSTLTTLLGQKADLSSFLHETSHYFLTVMGDMGGEDFDKLLNWFGVKDKESWDSMSLDEQRKYHEQFAYNYEKYLAEGKAPSIEAQGMFDRFTQWLKRVYKSVRDDINTIYRQQHGEDLPILTGEVRQVMDRMIASDEQIRQAEAIRSMEPVFKSQETSGMNDAEWNAYKDMAATATSKASDELTHTSIREMQWQSTAEGRLLKAMQAQHEALREDARKEVRDEIIRQDPVYSAQNFLKTGELIREGESETLAEHKLDTAAVKKMNGDSLDAFRGMTKKGGLDPEIAAPLLGFEDGKALIEAIQNATPLKDAVDAATDRRMLERHGEISTPEGMQAAVEKAVHNEARARLIAFELRHAFNMTDSERVLVKAARETAKRILGGQKFSEINPQAYAAREARAARQAQVAAARGDVEAVGKAKREQLLQHALTSEAMKIREEADKHLRYLNKFDNPSTAVTKAIGSDHMDAINELIAGYALSARERYSDRSESMTQWVNSQYDRTGVMPSVSQDLISRLGTMNWRDMTIGQLRDLRDAVKSLDYTGRRASEVQIAGKMATVDEMVAQVQQTLADMPHTRVSDLRSRLQYAKGLDKISAKFLDKKSWIRSADAALLKMEQIFQWIDAGKEAGVREAPIDGPMQTVFKMATESEAKERTMRAEASKAMRDLGAKLKGAKVELNEALDVPELQREDGSTRWYRGELISMALNMGNQSNKEKLLLGYGWSELQAISAINRHLSTPEMEFVQGVWNHLDSYGKDLIELQRRQTGVMPQMIEPTPVFTKHGTFKGGYYPVVYNDVLDNRMAEVQARNADSLFENNYSQPATASGHTITRTGYIGPLYLDLGVIARHIDQVTHDLSWRESIVDMNKVLSDSRLRQEIDQVYGREYTKQFRPWLQSMANDRVFNTAGDSSWEGFVRKVRSNATMTGIGFRLSTMAIHGTSALSNSIGEVGSKWFTKGIQQFIGPDRIQATRDFIYDRSPEMANRLNEADRNMHEVISGINEQQNSLDGVSASTKMYNDVRKFAFRGVGMLDMASAMPTWMGAYLKGMAKESEGGLNLGEEDAIEYANRAVRNAHGGGGVKDLSAVQRDKGVMSLATMFYSYWNHVYNRQRDLGKGWSQAVTGKVSARDFPKLLARSWFYIAVPQIAHAMLSSQQPDDNSLEGYAKELAEGIGLGFVSGVPLLRDLAAAAVHGRDYTFTPLESAGNTLVKTMEDAAKLVQGEQPSKRAAQNAAETAGYALGLPLSQPAASAKFLWDVMDGDARPKDLKDWYQGILTGHIR